MYNGDVRELKYIIEKFKIDAVILPDISETLDAPYVKGRYNRIPEGGTKIEEIVSMGDSTATIEMGYFVEGQISPGTYLSETFGVPLYKCKTPIGISNSDKFIKLLSKISNKEIPESLKKERGRALDAMIDSHKYNGEGKAAIFGEPELLTALYDLLNENGIEIKAVATGTRVAGFEHKLISGMSIKNISNPVILEDSDFNSLKDVVLKNNVNVLIGTSEGAFIEEKHGIPLVRTGFPVHDRVGTTREINIGYRGSIMFLDKITNTLLDKKYSTYRERMYTNYYEGGAK